MPALAMARAWLAKPAIPVPGISKSRTWRSMARTMVDGSTSRAALTRSR